ncbi:MAG: type II toxin-antitoxin system mRNA interferase toxin, RelE/StbE family [Proteobacteria bacterium]|nr:type II toxin-antitoxin system mRNA interferase toxin, RelE/StbE family [Pseudomonadota bacterium]
MQSAGKEKPTIGACPGGLRLIRGFRDESLRGRWNGHRSSRLGDQYRIIYRIGKKRLYVMVVDVTAHDY